MKTWRLPRIVAALLAASAWAWAFDHPNYIRPIQKDVPAAGLTQVVLQNLVGPISVQTNDGNVVHLEVLVHAGGPDATFRKTLASQLDFTVQNLNGQLRITGVYPLEHFHDYGYPRMKSILGIHGTDNNEYDGQKVFIRNVGSKKAVELWAEVRLTLPTRLALVLRNTYGDVDLHGGAPGGAPVGSLDGFTDVGDFSIYRPLWSDLKIQSDYGKVEFTDGFGAAKDIHISTDVGGAYLDLPPACNCQIIAHKDLGFLHNDVNDAKFSKDSDGDSVLQLGTGQGAQVHVDMSVGSLHLSRIGG